MVTTWVGGDVKDLVNRWGVPQGQYQHNDGSGILEYLRSAEYKMQEITALVPEMESGHFSTYGDLDLSGTYQTTRWTEQTISNEYIIKTSCYTKFQYDTKGKIETVTFRGNNCYAKERKKVVQKKEKDGTLQEKLARLFKKKTKTTEVNEIIKESEIKESEIIKRSEIIKESEIIKKSGITTKQSSLPTCKGTDDSQWTNCFGIRISPSGRNYAGEFKDGKRHGQGTETWASGEGAGDKFVGEFKDDKKNGKGTYTRSDGTYENVKYRDGERI